MMHISSEYGIPLVKAFEGCLKPIKGRPGYFGTYYCPAGVLTIGYGHTNLGGVPPTIDNSTIFSQEECDRVLAADMSRFEKRVFKILGGQVLNQSEIDALVSFDFNTGGLDRSSIPAKIKSGRREQVSETLARWNKAKVNGELTELAGLTRRRKAEGLLFDGRADEAMRVAGTQRAVSHHEGEIMPQRVERPKPPATEVAKRASAEIGTTIAGGTTHGAGHAADYPGIAVTAMWIGAAIVAIGVIALIRKYKIIDADWA